jgi:tRNA dimethylallyltransferase
MPIAILGPTASGKSAVAVALAQRLGGTVVNGDPYQALAGLAIGTGQPSLEEQGGVPHVGYGALPLSSRPNPDSFGVRVRQWLAAQQEPVLVTGSGLYLRGIWEQLTPMPEVPEALVARVRHWGQVLGSSKLHRFLQSVDPQRSVALHPHDSARVQRALALHLCTGKPASDLLPGTGTGMPPGWRVLVVSPGRDCRRQRVALRVADQIRRGWAQEVEGLVAKGHAPDLEALKPLGYGRWMTGGDPAEIEADIVRDTQLYAKRQATWFRNQCPQAATWDPDAEPLELAFLRLGFA